MIGGYSLGQEGGSEVGGVSSRRKKFKSLLLFWLKRQSVTLHEDRLLFDIQGNKFKLWQNSFDLG